MTAQLNPTQWRNQEWRLNNLYWITDKVGKRVPFRMNWAQQAWFDEMHYNHIILKARQLGFSTFIQLLMLDSCVFDPNIRAGVIAHTRDDAEAIFRDKVRYPYDNLPEGIRAANPANQESARQLSFENNSSLRVGTSLRSGTFQYLHVSEFGKICAKFPEKAREIVTGAFNTVQAGQFIFVESTAEGQDGAFYDMCQVAQEKHRRHVPLTDLDFKFSFFPWWKHPEYAMKEKVDVPNAIAEYFHKLVNQGIHLQDGQKTWYIKKSEQQGSDMKREYPSTPEEAFEAAIEGAYYADLLAAADESGRVTHVPHDSAVSVETWWDLGLGDLMSIWFVQRVGKEVHFIDYYSNAGEGLAHYTRVLEEKQRAGNWTYLRHVWPHDGAARILDEEGRKRTKVMADLGYHVDVVKREGIQAGIEACRNLIPSCWFDSQKCHDGLRGLRQYRKDWDDKLGTWKRTPRHDECSHPADAFRTGAMFRPAPDDYHRKLEYPNYAQA